MKQESRKGMGIAKRGGDRGEQRRNKEQRRRSICEWGWTEKT
jgi:hypothetical protein